MKLRTQTYGCREASENQRHAEESADANRCSRRVSMLHRFDGVVPITRGEETIFFDACQQGIFLIQHCGECGESVFYPRSVCPSCLAADLDWVEACGRGHVFTYTVQVRTADAAAPPVLAIVQLEEGPRLMTRLMCSPAEAAIGLPVRVEFAVIDDTGFRVPVFVPVSDSPGEAT